MDINHYRSGMGISTITKYLSSINQLGRIFDTLTQIIIHDLPIVIHNASFGESGGQDRLTPRPRMTRRG